MIGLHFFNCFLFLLKYQPKLQYRLFPKDEKLTIFLFPKDKLNFQHWLNCSSLGPVQRGGAIILIAYIGNKLWVVWGNKTSFQFIKSELFF